MQSTIFYILKNYTSVVVDRSFGEHIASIFAVEKSYFFVGFLLVLLFYPEMETKISPETSVDLHRTIRC